MQTSSLARARHATILSLVMTGIAIALYPGGTALDHSIRGYSWSQNFLSDLGMTVAYDGRSNMAGALCFVVGLCVLVLALGSVLVTFVRRYAAVPAARSLAYAAGATGLLVCAAFIGVALAPEDRALGWHVRFTLLGFDVLPVVVLFLALAARSSRAPRAAITTWALLCAALASYAALLEWGPALGTSAALTIYVMAQKLAALTLVLTTIWQTVVAERTSSPIIASAIV